MIAERFWGRALTEGAQATSWEDCDGGSGGEKDPAKCCCGCRRGFSGVRLGRDCRGAWPSGNSGGRVVNLELETEFDAGTSLEISPRVGVSMLDQKYVDYYYGVRLGEASLSRPAYTGRSARNVELGVRATYAYGKQHLFIFDASSTKLARSIRDSPIVGRSSQAAFLLSYAYRF